MDKALNWDLLRSFLTVARTGKLTKAARALKIDHSTLSRRVKQLERELDTHLFTRSLTGYELTKQGEKLLEQVEKMESTVFGINQEFSDEKSSVSGTVRIGAPDGFGTAFLAPRIGLLLNAHPNLEVEIVAASRRFSLSKREADIGIGLFQPTLDRHNAVKLTDYELGLYISRQHQEKFADLRTVRDLPRFPFISYIDDLIFTPELDYLSSVSKDIVPQIRSSNLLAQMRATISGAGVCVLPCFLANERPDLVRVLPDDVKIMRTFWMVTHSDTQQLFRVRAAAAFIAAQARTSSDFFTPR
ncbi:LysR family transcriptional regulator [Roseovarius dicentrarchi]|uniref:LysR family transcriptional regulator n=1 Tax=Roseovarius dicentrarchi TaxID=2250573 RepID=UPI000DE875B3|nr:LysR family transcriptional regulator [Roseovarius dicentrarchi]